MINLRTLTKLVCPMLVAVLASCSPDAPTQPQAPQASASLVDGLVGTVDAVVGTAGGAIGGTIGSVAPALLVCPTANSYTSTKVIGPAGGVIKVGPHTFTVPTGALTTNVKITASAPAGSYVKVDFQPEGLRFAKSTQLTLSYRECGFVEGLLLRVAYVDEGRILELVGSSNSILSQTVTGKVDHFSGYAIAF
jgi:hypothetical protein